MTKLILARHGIYTNPEDIVPFRSNDYTLSEEGIKQIERNANFLREFEISQIYSSPIERCRESAQIFSKILNVGIVYDNDIQEIDSPLKNTPATEYKKLMNGESLYANKFHLSNGGESLEQVMERVERFLRIVLTQSDDQVVLAVSHGDPIMLLVLYAQKIKFDITKTLESQTDYIKKGGMIELDFDGLELVGSIKKYF